MKNKYRFSIAFQEMIVHFKLFCLYGIITAILLSVSIFMLYSAMHLPDMIASSVHDLKADELIINAPNPNFLNKINEKNQIVIVNSYFSNIQLTNKNLSLKSNEKNSDGGIILDYDNSKSELNAFISDNLINGTFENTAQKCIWVSDKMVEAFEISVDDKLNFSDEQNAFFAELTVSGIYRSNDEYFDYYISSDCYRIISDSYKNAELCITIYPIIFREVFSIVSDLKDMGVSCFYDEQIVNSVRMLYITFYVLTAVLVLTLFSIFTHLLNTYYERRMRYFAVNTALGMSDNDTVHVLTCIMEILIVFITCVSIAGAHLINSIIIDQVYELFGFRLINNSASVLKSVVFNFMMLQLGIILIAFNFRKKIRQNTIFDFLRDNQ